MKLYKSTNGNTWQIELDQIFDKILAIQNTYKLSYLTSFVLAQRMPFEEVENYLSSFSNLNDIDFNKIYNFENAIKIFNDAIINKKKIGIISDYDVDGISSAVILTEVLDLLKIEYEIWIPNRQNGYGVTKEAVEELNNKKIDLLMTLDCGSSAIDILKNNKCIIIDHHRCIYDHKEENITLVNPNNLSNFAEGFQNLCAATLTFIFLNQAIKKMNLSINANFMDRFLNLCATATICDIMKIDKLNKYFISKGLDSMQERVGLFYLMQNAKIKNSINEKDIAFKIGPRINAAGRIDDAFIAYNLLKSNDRSDALLLADKIERINNSRKAMQQSALKEAVIEAEKQKNDNIIIICSKDWNIGIIGIIAAQVQEQFQKPCIVGCIIDDIVKASARAKHINLGYLIEKALEQNILISGGGHFAAAGLSCKLDKLEAVKQYFENEIQKMQKIESINRIDAIITYDQLDKDFIKLAPFGQSNLEIVVMLENIIINKIIDKKTYILLNLVQNFHEFTLLTFANNKNYKTLQELNINNNKFKCLLRLDVNNYHEIIDIVL